MKPARKDFEDHLLSWYGLLLCGLMTSTVGAFVFIFAFGLMWDGTFTNQAEVGFYLFGLSFLALAAGLCAIVWGIAKLVLGTARRVKKLSHRR